MTQEFLPPHIDAIIYLEKVKAHLAVLGQKDEFDQTSYDFAQTNISMLDGLLREIYDFMEDSR